LPAGGLRVTVKGEVLSVNLPRLAAIRHHTMAKRTYHQARPFAERQVVEELWRRGCRDVTVDEDQFIDLVTESRAFELFMSTWWPVLEAPDVLRRLSDPAVIREVAGGQLSEREIEVLAASYAPPDFSVADMALLDEIVALLGAAPRSQEPDLFLEDPNYTEIVTIADRLTSARDEEEALHSTYAHILVDESQDVTPMQWRMLRRRGPQASWTIVGDPAQSSWPDPAETSRSLDNLVGQAPRRLFRLSTNYRSPAEVFDLAAQVITRSFPEADLPRAVRRTGVEPRLLTLPGEDLVARVASITTGLLAEVDGTVGVIAPERWRAALDGALVPPGATGRLLVTDPVTVKGLEYDAVVVVDPDQIVAESSGRERGLYVCLSRPTQILVTVDPDRPGAWRPGDRGLDSSAPEALLARRPTTM